jgi:alpha-D-xyloside xylohydrolase
MEQKNNRIWFVVFSVVILVLSVSVRAQIPMHSADENQRLLNEVIDISKDFRNFSNTYYCADRLTEFDPDTGRGTVRYSRYEYFTRQAFDNVLGVLRPVEANEFPEREYAASPELPFAVELISPRTVRIRAISRFQVKPDQPSLMLANGTVSQDRSGWKYEKIDGGHRYTSRFGSVTITTNPWRIELRDAEGRMLTHTIHIRDDGETFTPLLPFSFVRRAADYSTSMAAVFRLSPDEKIFGCGESFTEFNKRGQKVVLYSDDSNGTQNETMYKPIPFFLSSRGYGMFIHTSSPITCDFGKYYSSVNSMMIGDDELDLFVFLGQPKEVLAEYTNLTGRAPMPPLWSFGLWMSRCTYSREDEVRDVAAKLRQNKIPCDVIHLDTGWFETDWRCDYKFSTTRFKDPAKMITDLKDDGFRISLWQLPYFVPKNTLFSELIEKGLVVRDPKNNLTYEDAVLDFSNPATVEWYQAKLVSLLKMGVGAIKVDFGEAAPANGLYASGRTGFYEHNLYPLRYNKAVADITKKTTGENIIWARSAWAGSQRYPIHWGGDAESTDGGMAAELRGGLSFGISGFSFWSHDIGGFVSRTSEDLYKRWMAFGMLTSHSRCHGTAPKEPWNYSPAFMDAFRRIDELKYRLMPYVYAQAKDCSERGLPMVRALFIECPNDPGCWLINDEYLFGSDMLVAPLMHEGSTGRDVYLPPGKWIDYQSNKVYTGGWSHIEAGEIPAVIMVKDGAVIPHIKLAQSTAFMDWSSLELVIFAIDNTTLQGLVFLPAEQELRKVVMTRQDNQFRLTGELLPVKVTLTVRQVMK